ncbi:ComEA family DNA-binding protein [Mycobacterium sp. SM1]|uniref:ComEA family DNA-binding protein n=1 Tax=Mycobacterium sp. SM1 TaxID=2816243 RepID=UPI001BCB124B|nr:ComEA family DNA-binding protein [Mycobacterium sp. SM1]MBS4727170.1 ComEA family DNA-binding protein [Mycobacterium sp. SM1]
MRPELPVERLHRRLATHPDALGARPDAEMGASADPPEETDADDSPDSLLPRWLPEASSSPGWFAKVRADPGRAGVVALAGIAAIAVLVTVLTVMRQPSAPVVSAKLPAVEAVSSVSRGPAASPSATPGQPVVVSVVGLVHRPGLVTLAPGARIADALAAAGGTIDGADTIGLNMARQLGDGEQIVVGLSPAPGQPKVLGSSVTGGSATSGIPPASSRTANSPAPKPGEVIDLNTATVQQLDALPGVGPVTAAAIVAWRDANGKFTSVDQLADVDGIGPGRLEKLRPHVRV